MELLGYFNDLEDCTPKFWNQLARMGQAGAFITVFKMVYAMSIIKKKIFFDYFKFHKLNTFFFGNYSRLFGNICIGTLVHNFLLSFWPSYYVQFDVSFA